MFLLKKFLSAWLLPPFGMLVLAIVLLCVTGRRKLMRVAVGLLIAATIALSLPIVTARLAASIETDTPISARQLTSTQAIVILGGGVHYGAPEYDGDTVSKFALERLRYGAKLARESHLPILVTGGMVYGGEAEASLMKQILEKEFGVPVRWSETQSRNTAENALYSFRLLKAAGVEQIVLVTHASHMKRARLAFEYYGMKVLPAPTSFAPQGTPLFESLLPSAGSFERSTMVLREWIGLIMQRAIDYRSQQRPALVS